MEQVALRAGTPPLWSCLRREVNAASGVRPARRHVVTFIKEQRADRIAPPLVTKSRPRSLKSAQPDPGGGKGMGAFSFTLYGQKIHCKNGKELIVAIFSKFAEHDETFCKRFAEAGIRTQPKVCREEQRRPVPGPSRVPDPQCCRTAWWVVDRDSHPHPAEDEEVIRGGPAKWLRSEFGRDIIVCMPRG